MSERARWLHTVLALALCASTAWAQEPAAAPATATEPAADQAAAAPAATPAPAAEEAPAEAAGEYEEIIVVTASRTQQNLADAPSAVSVFTAEDIQSIPADDYGDLLRNVPGVNVTQTSARDINMTARGSTNTLSTSQLVLMDGRSLYLDFFGFVMWDFLPVNPNEIKQIEAVRGPGSAVWGANAMTGVVNLITKRPREMVGTSILLGGGEVGTLMGSITHAGASETFGYKVSAGYYEQDAYERPQYEGVPSFENQGTEQPKADVRLDWDIAADQTFSVGGGYAGTDGIIHTGIGPFDIDKGSDLTYAKADWTRQAFHVGLFLNYLDADSTNLVSRGIDGQPLGFAFSTDTLNFDIGNTSVLGTSNIFTYGGNYRDSKFDLEIAPQGEEKTEWGVFLQDEILFGGKARWLIGARYDEIDPLDDGVVTPRTSFIFAPKPEHTFRISYNEAFRTPSVINNYLDAQILVGTETLLVPARAQGPELLGLSLNEEHLTAYEVGYVGLYDHNIVLTVAAYHNVTEDAIDFFTARHYGGANVPAFVVPPQLPQALRFCFAIPPTPAGQAPPQFRTCPGPIPGFVGLGAPPPGHPLFGLYDGFPSNFSYRNIGETTDEGVEFSIQQRRDEWNWFFNASWQDEPKFEGLVQEGTQNLPPEWRANLGLGYDVGRWFVNTNINYQDEAFWADVALSDATVGFTDAFTQVNIGAGVRLLENKMTLQLTGSNIFDEDVQQHYFGDIIGRKITGQVLFQF